MLSNLPSLLGKLSGYLFRTLPSTSLYPFQLRLLTHRASLGMVTVFNIASLARLMLPLSIRTGNHNMLIHLKMCMLLCACLATPALAQVIVLDFEGAGDRARLLDFYNGGTDSRGSNGINYGIQFGANALSLRDRDVGGSGNFANEPSPDTVLFFTAGSAVLNYAWGFEIGFSFFYSAKYAARVLVYDDLNASGKLLAAINFLPQYADNCMGDPTGTYCNWKPAGASFDGIARSVDFGGTVMHTGYDNVTFGSAIPGGMPQLLMFQTAVAPLPEPATWALLSLGLLGVRALQRCKTNRTSQHRNASRHDLLSKKAIEFQLL